MPLHKATPEQLALVKTHRPDWDWITDGEFQGDDNDMAVVITSIAIDIYKAGYPAVAFAIETLAPPGFFHCDNLDEYMEIMKRENN